jgi:hypothetical protein
MVCFDLSGFTPLTESQLYQYRNDWNTFERIQAFNSNVSTQHSLGNLKVYYYTYITNEEKNSFTKGQQLHTVRYPTSNWNVVQQN